MSVFYDLVTENELIDVHKMDCQGISMLLALRYR